MFIRIIYTVFVAVLLSLFVFLGIQAFYPEPEFPQMPVQLEKKMETGQKLEASQTEEWEKWSKAQKVYEAKIKVYNRNVSTIALLVALCLMICALTFLKQIQMISDGILLGGVFVLLNSMGRSFGSGDSRFVFIMTSVELVMTLFLGYAIFVKEQPAVNR